MSLIARLNKEQGWEELEESICEAAMAGGNQALVYYGRPLAFGLRYDATTQADTASTLAIIQNLESSLSIFAEKYGFSYSYFGEEFEKLAKEGELESEKERIREMVSQLGDSAVKVSKRYSEFSKTYDENHLSVLFDPLDGTIPFRAEMPFFCSGIAFLIEGRPVIGAIYNPTEQVVYCASLRDETTSVKIWSLRFCSLLDLKKL